MRVRLVKKYAESIDGVDLSGHAVGATLRVEQRAAELLIAEGWAVPAVKKKKVATHISPGLPHSDPPSLPPITDRRR